MTRLKKFPKGFWRTELVSVAIDLDELCIGAKDQSNVEIAGFPRNLSEQSVKRKFKVVKH